MRLWLAILVLMSITGCSDRARDTATHSGRGESSSAETAEHTVAEAPQIVVLGDSLTAGLGLAPEQSFPARLQARLQSEGYRYRVINAGVSGDTSAGGLRRLDWALEGGDVRVLVVALGANDGLRGLPTAALEENLNAIVAAGRERGLSVLLAGMEAPPNNGPEYTAAFRKVYRDVAKRHDVPLLAFLLEGVAGDPALNQDDGIHPSARGAQVVADHLYPALHPLLGARKAGAR